MRLALERRVETWLLAAAVLVAAAVLLLAQPSSRKQEEQLYPADLGRNTIDVNLYPEERRRQYQYMAGNCSQCHTLARAINSPRVTREEWRPVVDRMHGRSARDPVREISREDAALILDFLAWDSYRRKVAGKAGFDAEQRRLQRLFDEVRRGRL